MNADNRLLDRVIGRRAVIGWSTLIFALSSIPNFWCHQAHAARREAVHAIEFSALSFRVDTVVA